MKPPSLRALARGVFSALVLTPALAAHAATAVPTTTFLESIGVCSTFPDRGQPIDKTIEMVKYGGFRWVRGGIEGLTDSGPTTVQTYLDLHNQTGVKFSWGLVSGGTDLEKLIRTAREIEKAGALLSFEGNNEPNNWGVTYQGEKGGGQEPSWMAVAKLQRDLYKAVKSDPQLAKYPVWSISENGAQRDNVGLQFLTIPAGANTKMPDGTKYADAANCHNYIYHSNAPLPADNKTWNASDPSPACKVDGLYGNYGKTWAKGFPGYSQAELDKLPRVTTETGMTINADVTEELHAIGLMNFYLSQYKRGWSHTSVYLLRDRTDESGNQAFGFFDRDYKPRQAAHYLHNLTTILADKGQPSKPGQLAYTIANQPETVHDLLLQRSDGAFQLVIWGERLKGEDHVTIDLGAQFPKVTIHDPTKGTDVVKTHTDVRTLDLVLTDHPLILTIPKA